MANGFSSRRIPLVRKGEVQKVDGMKLVIGGCATIHWLAASPEAGVLHAKWVRVPSGASVLSGAEKEEEGKPDHVGSGEGFGVSHPHGYSLSAIQDWDGDGFDMSRGRILVGITMELPDYAGIKGATVSYMVGIGRTQPGVRLCNE